MLSTTGVLVCARVAVRPPARVCLFVCPGPPLPCKKALLRWLCGVALRRAAWAYFSRHYAEALPFYGGCPPLVVPRHICAGHCALR